jgi:hypothetical protein
VKTSGMVAVRFTVHGGDVVLEQVDGAVELRVVGTDGRERVKVWIESDRQAKDMAGVLRQLAAEVCP